MTEEGAFGQAGPVGDLGDRRRVEPLGGVELQGRLLQAAPGIGLPAAHDRNPSPRE